MLLVALAESLAGARGGETLTIASYNVENYVAADRMTPDGYRRDYPKPEEQKRALRQVIAAMRAEVLVLQEMGDERYLHELQRDLERDGLAYSHRAHLKAADPARHLAVLSQRPFAAVVPHHPVEFPYFGARERVKRGVLELRFATPAGELVLFAVHLKSRFTERTEDPESEQRRLGEATAVRDLVLARVGDLATARFAIIGDFNADPSAAPVRRLLRRGDTPVAVLLAATDSRGETWTYCYQRQHSYTRVDHVLVSQSLLSAVVDRTARIYDGPGTRDASDHRPLIVTLEFGRSAVR